MSDLSQQQERTGEPGDDIRHQVEDWELGGRREGAARWLIPGVAATWSLFQLSLPYLVSLDSVYIRAIHLSFAIALVFLSYPALKKPRLGGPFKFLSAASRTPCVDVCLAILAALAAAYFALDYIGISARAGMPISRDVAAGALLIVLLLEAARRSLGPALPIVAATFLLYALYAEKMPSLIAFRSVSVDRMFGQLTLSTEGIYGTPLYVSASTVFLFVLFGAFLDKTGGGEFFVRLALSLLGRFKGGAAKAAVLASGLSGMVSGSSIANVVTTGTFTIPLMKRTGYPAEKAAAVEVAASTNGQLMPPIMGAAAFIIAEYCGITYFEVVRAAFIPAILSYLALLYITHIEASKLGLKGIPVSELPPFWETLRGGIHFLLPLGLLLYLLIVKRYSPELSAFWSIIVLVLTAVGYNLYHRKRDGRGARDAFRKSGVQVGESLVAGGRNMMSIGVAVAAAGIIVGIVSLGPGQRITEVVDHVAGGNIYVILMMTALASLLLGMGLPTTANYIVMASLTAQVIVTLAGDSGYAVPLIAAHLFCFYFGILADDTPPVGLAAYAAAAIAKSDPIRTGLRGFSYDLRTAILPFMFFFNLDLLLWEVDAGWHIVLIFVTGLVGMCAFAALVQNFMLVPNRALDRLLLLLASVLLLQPLVFQHVADLDALPWGAFIPWTNKWLWKAFGLAAFGTAIALQWRRRRAGSPPSAP